MRYRLARSELQREEGTPSSFSAALCLLVVLLLLVSVEQKVYADLYSDLDAIIDSPKNPAAHWGVRIEESGSGTVVYSRNGDTPFIPASVGKLVTTAVALDRLGPDYTFTTHIQYPFQIFPASGVIDGDVRLIGGGDPTLGTAEGAGGRKVFEYWAKLLVQEGVTQVNGNIIGVDSVFIDEPLGQGGAWDDEHYAFSAHASGLTVHEGTAGYKIEKNSKQRLKKKQISLYPRSEYLTPQVKVTGEHRQLKVDRRPGTNQFVVEVPQKMKRNPAMSGRITVNNPTLYAATLFKEALQRAGIKVNGDALDSDQTSNYKQGRGLVWSHRSKPLSEILPLANKRSINLVAEHLLRSMGVRRNKAGAITHSGSVERGLRAITQFFSSHKIKPYRYKLVDGSGLSRYNLIRPEDLVKVLEAMAVHAQSEVFKQSLSQAGRDGTLKWRFRETPLEGKVWAKTGTLSSIRAIAGYVTTPKGKSLTFSILVNNYASGSRKIRNAMDRLLLKAVEWVDNPNRRQTKKR
ncbi:MAG: D-alanyl-D-alanine carboxypeptidase/D-alanyl-D-alanine-endopeptidase [Gammaproteobacteria bacterium]|nr:D-alanyl-D-alanine carboxypeptidase/D-alanyl-D-alanine-endopeptidase [Gammaproteobacteria bacterium]